MYNSPSKLKSRRSTLFLKKKRKKKNGKVTVKSAKSFPPSIVKLYDFSGTESGILFHREIDARAPRLINLQLRETSDSFTAPLLRFTSSFFYEAWRSTLAVFPKHSPTIFSHPFLASFLKRDFNPTVRAREMSRTRERNRPTTRLYGVRRPCSFDLIDFTIIRKKTYPMKIPSYFYRGIFKAFTRRSHAFIARAFYSEMRKSGR